MVHTTSHLGKLSFKLQYVINPSIMSVLHSGEASVYTEIQAGPLYRVVGHPLFISCNVSGFANEHSDKDFEFRIAKPSRPTFEINIISTNDPTFSYAVYGTRVSNQEISLKRLSPNSVVFEIQRLEKGDEGEFDCSVVNSESIFDGTYSAKSTVRGNQSAFYLVCIFMHCNALEKHT